jgi:glycine cleavage system H protein
VRLFYFYQPNFFFLGGFPMSSRAESKIPAEIKFTDNDEWVRVECDIAFIGITDYAQDQLSDVVFVEYLLDEGEEGSKGDTCAAVESVKAAADVYLPVSGEVVAVNEDLADEPETINSDPYGDAWMLQVKMSDPSEIDTLLNAAGYQDLAEDH